MTNPNKIKETREENEQIHTLYNHCKKFRQAFGWSCENDLGIYERDEDKQLWYSFMIQPLKSLRKPNGQYYSEIWGEPITLVMRFSGMIYFLDLMYDFKKYSNLSTKLMISAFEFLKTMKAKPFVKKYEKEYKNDPDVIDDFDEIVSCFTYKYRVIKLDKNVIKIDFYIPTKKEREEIDNDPYLADTGLD